MVPRDHFSHARVSLESLLEHTPPAVRMIYVDHGAPPPVRAWLERTCRERGIERIAVERPLTPNEARNLALRRVTSRYVVFVDNDAVVTPGWLEPLVETAEARGAWLVGPLYLIGKLARGRVHMAGGELGFREVNGRRWFHETHRHPDAKLADVLARVTSEPTQLVEFHCMLARTDALERMGGLDEALLTHAEHVDLCLRVRAAGGSIWFEPRSLVTYLPPRPVQRDELAFYLMRWNEAWNRASIDHFCEKWGLAADDPYREHQTGFLRLLRRRALSRLAWPVGRGLELLVYRKPVGPLVEPLVQQLEAAAIRSLVAARQRSA
jgi:glycosyltransferase involved in cell wall biosynthesis